MALETGLKILRRLPILMTLHQALNQVNHISLPERLENVSGHVEKNFLHPKKSRMKSILRIIRIIIT
jgi:hypothetical protein